MRLDSDRGHGIGSSDLKLAYVVLHIAVKDQNGLFPHFYEWFSKNSLTVICGTTVCLLDFGRVLNHGKQC